MQQAPAKLRHEENRLLYDTAIGNMLVPPANWDSDWVMAVDIADVMLSSATSTVATNHCQLEGPGQQLLLVLVLLLLLLVLRSCVCY